MALSSMMSPLPTLGSQLPDLLRAPDRTPVRREDAGIPESANEAAQRENDPAAPRTDDSAHLIARRVALGPITYGRRAITADTSAAAPIGLRGVHLDVRG
jgi:hypothetical protein